MAERNTKHIMNKKLKNIITNILGLMAICGGGYSYFFMEDGIDFYKFGVSVAVGLALFLLEVSETKNYLKKFLNKKLEK